jgi:hypothetical protein
MNRYLFCLLLPFFMATAMPPAGAQAKQAVAVGTATQKGNTVRFTITSPKAFIFGSDRYVLHIGDKNIMRYEQARKDGKGTLTFLLTDTEFKALSAGDDMYLIYGTPVDGQDLADKAQQSKRCWSLGKFDPAMLK